MYLAILYVSMYISIYLSIYQHPAVAYMLFIDGLSFVCLRWFHPTSCIVGAFPLFFLLMADEVVSLQVNEMRVPSYICIYLCISILIWGSIYIYISTLSIFTLCIFLLCAVYVLLSSFVTCRCSIFMPLCYFSVQRLYLCYG